MVVNLLSALLFVDAVVVFGEDTPENLIKNIVPDVMVKGADYSIENIAGADFVIASGGKVELVPLVENFSTTILLEKMNNDSKNV